MRVNKRAEAIVYNHDYPQLTSQGKPQTNVAKQDENKRQSVAQEGRGREKRLGT